MPEEGIFRDLLNISSLRGFQGSGAIVYQKPSPVFKSNGAVRTIRSKAISGALAYSDELEDLFRPSCSLAIGHARWPTKGGTDEKALHPHRHGHIVGVHNGTLWRAAGQEVKEESDSSLFFKAVAEMGIREAIRETRGAYAFIWINEEEGTVNFLRNSQRTLFFKNVGYNKNIQTLYWASEASMLNFVFDRSFKGNNSWDTFMPEDVLISYPIKPGHIIRPVAVERDFKPDPFRPQVAAGGETTNGGHTPHGTNETHWQGHLAGYTWDFDQKRYVRDNSNVLPLLPPPDTSKDHSRNTAMTKTQQKKHDKRLRQEALKAARRRQAERVAEAAAKSRRAFPLVDNGEAVDLATEEAAPAPSVEAWRNPYRRDNLSQIRSALFGEAEDEAQDWEASLRSRDHAIAKYARGFYQRGCAWCGELANAGDRVHPVGSDLGGPNEFVCDDCSKIDDCHIWLKEQPVIVTMD